MIAITIGSRSAAAPAGYVPGLGEFMTATQMRHSKLWFAGQAGNWALASYELDEIKEGFADITRFHPTHPGSPVPIREILPKLMAAPLARLEVAIRSQNLDKFDDAFDSLTRRVMPAIRQKILVSTLLPDQAVIPIRIRTSRLFNAVKVSSSLFTAQRGLQLAAARIRI